MRPLGRKRLQHPSEHVGEPVRSIPAPEHGERAPDLDLLGRHRALALRPPSEADCRRAAFLAEQVTLLASPGMRRLKRALGTFMRGFSEHNLGERIHQFVRAVADGIANS